MSSELKLNFYDETVIIPTKNKNYADFKNEIAKRYSIDISDVTELIIYYFNNEKMKIFVRNETEYNYMVHLSRTMQVTVFLEICEESKLFKEGKNKFNPNDLFQVQDTNQSQNIDLIKKEIEEKKLLLEKTIKMEQEIEKKRLKEAEEKLRERNKFERLKLLREKKSQMEKDEVERKKREKEELQYEVTKLMNENLEKLKQTLIDNTVNQSLNIVDKQLEKRLQISQCKDVHYGFGCSSCGMNPIVGIRYSCGIAKDFHLCENCEFLIGESHQFPLIKYRNSNQGKLNLKIVIEDNNNIVNKDFDNDLIFMDNLLNKSK